MTERWIIDAGGPAPLVLPTLTRNGGCRVVEHRTPPPAPTVTWAKRPEGAGATSREYENREVSIKLALERPLDEWWSVSHDFGAAPTEAEGDGLLAGWTGTVRRATPDGSPIRPMVSDISAAMGKLQREGGTLTRVMDDGGRVTFDVETATDPAGPLWDDRFYVADQTTLELSFTCRPFGRGAERLLGQGTKAAGSRLLLVDGLQVPGDVPALARLEFSGATVAQQSLLYAIDRQTYPLEIAASSRLLPTPAATVAGSIAPQVAVLPASPAGTPAGTWELISYLRPAVGGRIALSGTHRVLARVRTASTDGAVLRLRWSAGPAEGGTTINPTCSLPSSAGWRIADLGTVTVPEDVGELDGVIEWAGPTTSTARALDLLLLVPAERSGRAYASTAKPIGGTVVAADSLTGTGALVGSAVQTGGTWSAAGTTGTGFARASSGATLSVTSSTVAVSAAPIARPAGSVRAQVRFTGSPGTSGQFGLAIGNAAGLAAIASRSSASSSAWAFGFGFAPNDDPAKRLVDVVVDGTSVKFANGTAGSALSTGGLLTVDVFQWAVPPQIEASAWANADGATTNRKAFTIAPAIPASPGQLYVGVWASGVGLTAGGTVYPLTAASLFVTAPTPPDRVLHPDRTAQLTSGAATRDTPAGSPGPIAAVIGDRPFLPPSGRAGVPARVLMGASRTDLRTITAIDDTADTFTGRVFATPRYLQIPDQNA
jgi:hypothetical protein